MVLLVRLRLCNNEYGPKLEDFIKNEQSDFIVGEDGNGINIGTFFLRNCEWSLDMLAWVWEQGPKTRKLAYRK